jgi:hypothetical protein
MQDEPSTADCDVSPDEIEEALEGIGWFLSRT